MNAPRREPAAAPFLPKLVNSLRGYSARKFTADLAAGVAVGLVALPLAMAFAISSGVPPQSGIYCAVVAGFIISALGGSTVQIGGPTGAFVVVVSSIVARYGMDGLFMCTMMAGVLLIILGVTGLGSAVKYIPRPVVIGFTNGIAVLIASTQIKDLLGLRIEHVPGEFLERMEVLARHLGTASPTAAVVSLSAVAVILLLARLAPRIPGYIVAMVAGTAATALLHLPLETLQTRFGGIPAGMPQLQWPAFRPELILPLLSPTLTVTMLGAIESLLSAVVADRMSGDRHQPNVELVAQGVANLVSPLVGGLPATGAIARTATNVRSGAQTPVAGMIHALTLLGVLLVGAPLAERIPLSVLAAILMVVAYNMGEWREIPAILRQGRADVAVWLITFALTVLADLTVAVEAGMILAALVYISRITSTTSVARVTDPYIQEGFRHSLQTNEIPPGAAVYRIHGPFLFGSTDKLNVVLEDLPHLPPVVVLRLRNMTAIDATGLHALEELAERLHASGRTLLLCGAREQPGRALTRADFHARLGDENILPDLSSAVARARELLRPTPAPAPEV